MFESLFLYPSRLFSKGEFVFASGWSVWLLLLLCAGIAAGIAFVVLKRHGANLKGARWIVIAALQTFVLCLLLFLLWRPGLRVTALKPQQNVVAVVIDDSSSMKLPNEGSKQSATRIDTAKSLLNEGLLQKLRNRFQVRVYRAGANLERIQGLDAVSGGQSTTHLGTAMKQMMEESASLPIGAVVLLSDGSDNAGGMEADSLNEIRRRRIPIHTVGFGAERLTRDVEVIDLDTPQRALSDSRIGAAVSFRNYGYKGQKAKLMLSLDGKIVSSREVTLGDEGVPQTETLLFNAGLAGARSVEARIVKLADEENSNNNAQLRLVNVESLKPRILYIEGEPKWDFKFIRRALDGDRNVQLTTMLRTTQNKIYRQGVENAKELEQGFPDKEEELFKFSGLMIGGVEASYFTPKQQTMIKDFADRRGGGVMFVAGRGALNDGGYAASSIAEIIPVTLSDRKGTFHRDPATAELTQAGRDSLIVRIEEDAAKNVERWKTLPFMANYQETGTAKAGATVLIDALPTSKGRFPLLVTERYGRGRTAVFASSGTWRWQMSQDAKDMSHELFWQQLLRWLVSETPAQIAASPSKQVLLDEGNLEFRADIRDKAYHPVSAATVEARVLGPGGAASMIPLTPDATQPGIFTAKWDAPKAGSYVVEVLAKNGKEEMGRDVFTFVRQDGVAENFHAEQNKQLLEGLSRQTNGNYYTPATASTLPEDIAYSEAGVTTRETKDLWNMPAFFLALFGAKGAEWLLRRRWGAV
ncbi:glutamine amidotransferase [Bryobacter aggregatus]|uniref:glutamine amidotransferase n=1 Tax=Bryobacter aggregatus TaxID=360054 RepID=UPI0004E0B46A|nr:glutamine amidotransferase [Bryobacter aggregatus]